MIPTSTPWPVGDRGMVARLRLGRAPARAERAAAPEPAHRRRTDARLAHDPDVIPEDLTGIVRLQKPLPFRRLIDAVGGL